MNPLKMVIQKFSKKRVDRREEEDSFDARIQMETRAQKHIEARLKAVELNIDVKGRK